jgi:hypothetical protein
MTMASAQSATEREQLLAALEKSTRLWVDTVTSIPDCACGVKLNDDGWSLLQIAEHVAAAEHGMCRGLELSVPKTTPPDYEKDRFLTTAVTNREKRLQAPGPSLPKGRWLSLSECLDAFKTSRARTIEMVRSADDLKGQNVQAPVTG